MAGNAAALIAKLARAFPRQPIPAGTFEVYLQDLADVPYDLLEGAVTRLIRSSDWFPSLHAIRSECADAVLGLPSEAAALAQVEERMRWARQDAEERAEEPPPVVPLVKQALDRVGGYPAFRGSDDPGRVRRQFGILYNQIREEALRNAKLAPAISGPCLPALPA